jgi:hypothetical protein
MRGVFSLGFSPWIRFKGRTSHDTVLLRKTSGRSAIGWVYGAWAYYYIFYWLKMHGKIFFFKFWFNWPLEQWSLLVKRFVHIKRCRNLFMFQKYKLTSE